MRVGGLGSLLCIGAVAASAGGIASAESTALGGSGWVATWDETRFDVRFEVNIEEPGLLAIRKIIDHTALEPVPVTFTPTTPDAIPIIEVLEQLTNSTGSTWPGYVFRIDAIAASENLEVRFDVAGTDIGGAGGFDPNPFASAVFDAGPAPQRLTVTGGAGVADGIIWQPGGLVIDTRVGPGNLGGFTLIESPADELGNFVPSPTAAALGCGLMFGVVGRRRGH